MIVERIHKLAKKLIAGLLKIVLRLINRYFFYFKPTLRFNKQKTHFLQVTATVFPQQIAENVKKDAQLILDGQIECFGTHKISDNGIEWDKDFYSGVTWKSGCFYKKYKLINVSVASDVKVPWELSRCHHLVPLAKTFLHTGDIRYAQRVEKDILDWINKNPFMRSINWTCAMEAAIRSVNWIWALSLCANYFAGKNTLIKINNSLRQHGLFIRYNLEKYPSSYSSNHYYANLVGLIYLSHYFASFPFSEKWKKFALPEFYKETLIQFHASGVNYELSTSYHRLMTEMLLSVLCLLKRHGEKIPAEILHRAEKAVDYIRYLTRDNGSVPLIGDVDDGRLHIFGRYIGWERDDFRHLLALGHQLFNNNKWAIDDMRCYEDAYYLLNDKNAFSSCQKSSEEPESRAFKDAGIYIMRKDKDSIVIKTSNRGAYETQGWHTHNDVLNVDVTINGVSLIVDPGVGNYTGDIKERNLFRSTFMHNTVVVDNTEQNTFLNTIEGLWTNNGEAIPGEAIFTTGAAEDELSAYHQGYKRLKQPVLHRRNVRFNKELHMVEINDTLEGEGKHRVGVSFILHPGVKVKKTDKTIFLLYNHQTFKLESIKDLLVQDGLYSPSYKQKVTTSMLCLNEEMNFPVSFTFKIGPC